MKKTGRKDRSKKYIFKIVVAGDGGVGKTTLLYKYVNGTFITDTGRIIGVQFHHKVADFGGNSFSLQLWDGADGWSGGADGAILLYDTTWVASLNNLEEWIRICRTEDKNLPILLCGTKIDLAEDRAVASKTAKQFLASQSIFDYVEISAKSGKNVDKAFEILCLKMKEIDDAVDYWMTRGDLI